jgi:23S rRNA (cytosine1962-C5)-methyltransferase
VREGPVRYAVDVRLGQKTGLFLDQRENHEAAMRYARGRGLDAFSYHGGFALRLAARCDAVVALDSSAPAIAQLKANAAANGLANIEARETNVLTNCAKFENRTSAIRHHRARSAGFREEQGVGGARRGRLQGNQP